VRTERRGAIRIREQVPDHEDDERPYNDLSHHDGPLIVRVQMLIILHRLPVNCPYFGAWLGDARAQKGE
jgi:hypothetical protein